jgi:hypothetical protein
MAPAGFRFAPDQSQSGSGSPVAGPTTTQQRRKRLVLLASRARACRREHEAIQQMIGGERETVDRPHPLGLAETQGRRDPELEAQPHHEPVYRPCPRMTPHVAWERSERRATASAERPVGALDKPPALLTRRAPQQCPHPARPLAADSLGRGLLHKSKLGRDYPHPRHRHRAHSPARHATENVNDTRAPVYACRSGAQLISTLHPVSLLPSAGSAHASHRTNSSDARSGPATR